MENRLMVTASPHLVDHSSTRKLMGSVILALLPCVVASTVIFGLRALLLIGVTTAACVGFEFLYTRLMKKPCPVGDLSAVVTGLILALNFPVTLPLWIAIVGAFIAIVVTKQLFGGLGFNFVNPALVGRIVLFTGFGTRMTAWTYPEAAQNTLTGIDAVASATPLQAVAADGSSLLGQYPLMDLLLGVHGGVLGETCAVAILLGFVWLVASRTISAAIPVAYVGSFALFSLLHTLVETMQGSEAAFGTALATAGSLTLRQVLSGGLLFGAVFMATDYVTSPFTLKGKLVFGLGLGLITFAIRDFANMPEGVSYAILFMNLLVPYINDLTRQKPLGAKKQAKGAA